MNCVDEHEKVKKYGDALILNGLLHETRYGALALIRARNSYTLKILKERNIWKCIEQ